MATRTEKARKRLAAARKRHEGEKIERLYRRVDQLIWDQRVRMAGPPRWAGPLAWACLALIAFVLIGSAVGAAVSP